MSRHYWVGGNRSYEQDRFFEASLDKSIWKAAENGENWDACWYTGMPGPKFFSKVGPGRKINHIPGNNALTVKSRLHQSLVTLRERVETQQQDSSGLTDRLQFVPGVFSMPEDYHAFQQAAVDNPAKRWILKPKNAARGKGIQLVRDPASVPLESSWMVQEYIENPHTMHGRKYVLRLYVLVSSVVPFRVYLYRQGFAKLASAPYDEANADNPYSYLTNPDVNALNLDAEVPVEFVDLDRYREWLREQGHDDQILFSRVEDMVTLTCLSALESMRERSRAVKADTQGCYELLGIDCLIDDQLKPWILECNLSPSLEVCAGPESGGDIEEGIKGSMVADLVSLTGLNIESAPLRAASPEEQLIEETRNELEQAGNFQRLFPCSDPERYLPYFTLPRLEDWVVVQDAAEKPVPQPALEPRFAEDMISDDQVYLYHTRGGHLSALNEAASLIWLMAVEGAGPDDIADALVESAGKMSAAPVDAWVIRKDVWDSLAGWATSGLLIQRWQDSGAGSKASAPEVSRLTPAIDPFSLLLDCGAFQVEFYTDSRPVVSRLEAILLPMASEKRRGNCSRFEVVRDTPGYTLILDGKVLQSRLELASVASAVMACLARNAALPGEIIIDAGLVADPASPDTAVLVAGGDSQLYDAVAQDFASRQGVGFSRAIRIRETVEGDSCAIGLPARIPEPMLDLFGQAKTVAGNRPAAGREGTLLPASAQLAGGYFRVNTVVVPSHAALEEKDGMRPLSVSETMRHLISGCCISEGRPLDASGFSRLADWLELCDRYLVDAHDLPSAARALSSIATAQWEVACPGKGPGGV
ncbi:amylase [Marinobacter sp.]|uniref:amylase n=1 Tax=Marinobacter sp. TaxID=50741 RepID=UPI00384A69B1